ncbi:MAG: hypothetical protein QOH41_4049 [Blastocatellia bacterium]|jgi:hypothetical protein|nr:hypothetical protein [Blastocatellia bacterium]
MKIAFHFDADHESLGSCYGWPIEGHLLRLIVNDKNLDIHSKIFVGDLLLHSLTMDVEYSETGSTHRFNKEAFITAVNAWINPPSFIWKTFTQASFERVLNHNVYIICFESLRLRDAERLDKALREKPYYLGAMQVDEESPVHWAAYAGSLVPQLRIYGKNINVFYEGFEEDGLDYGLMEGLKKLGFTIVEPESLNGKYTIFDKYHDFEHARRVANLNRTLGDTLGFVVDFVIARLSDPAPEIGNKIWSAITAFERAEVDEDYAHVAISCRRAIEYVTDQLFPPEDDSSNERKLGPKQYRNRLLAFADRERKSDTNVDLICVSTEALAQQLEKLSNLANKGIHSDVARHEARRCLIRTILLLDDVLSLKTGTLQIKDHLDDQLVREMFSGDDS